MRTIRAEHKQILDLRSNLGALQELVYLLVRHLLSELRQDVSELSRADEAVPLLVEHLETTDELLCWGAAPSMRHDRAAAWNERR